MLTLPFLVVIATYAAASPPDPILRSGDWSLTVESEPTFHGGPSAPRPAAIASRQTVVRRNDREKRVDVLFEQTSTGSVRIALGQGGVAFVKPVGAQPRLYFPTRQKPVLIQMTLPTPKSSAESVVPLISNDVAPTFIGDVLFFFAEAYLHDCAANLVDCRVERDKVRVCALNVDVLPTAAAHARVVIEMDPASAFAARPVESPPITRVDDYLLWLNAGDAISDAYPSKVAADWRPRRLRILDLRGLRLVPFESLPPQFVAMHGAALKPFLDASGGR